MKSTQAIHVDLWRLLQHKLGSKGKFLPHWLVRPLESLICQDFINKTLEALHPLRGPEFCRALLRGLEASLSVHNSDKLPANSRTIFVCNHPLGGLDGISLIAFLSEQYPGRIIRVVVNDLLMAIEPLADNFLPINKFGRQDKGKAALINSVLAGDDPVLMFPAGLVSRIQPGGIRDLDWQKSFITMATSSDRPIVPLYFDGLNTGRFYRTAQLRTRLGLKFNIEQTLLPREVLASRGNRFSLYCGEAMPASLFHGGHDAGSEAARVRAMVYDLPSLPQSNTRDFLWK